LEATHVRPLGTHLGVRRMARLFSLSLRTLALLAGTWFGLHVGAAGAFQLLPMSMEFAPTGNNATQTFAITNEATEPVAVQIFIVQRSVALDGTETLTPADAEFLVFPPQAAVPAGKTQLVQVRWLGNRAPTTELAYRIVAEQLPVTLENRAAQGARLEILMRYEGSLYITPPGVTPDVVVESVARVQTAEGGKLAVVLHNKGTAHGLLDQTVLTLAGRGTNGQPATVELRAEALAGMASPNILAGNKRQFLLPGPATLAAEGLTGTLRANYVR
jgi:fimbrial chaperone protein